MNEFDVQSVLHGKVSLAAVNQICAIHEAMNSCKKSIDSLKDFFENVNIVVWLSLSCGAMGWSVIVIFSGLTHLLFNSFYHMTSHLEVK